MGLYSGGLINGRILAFEIWGAYFREDFFLWGGWGGGLLIYFQNTSRKNNFSVPSPAVVFVFNRSSK